MTVAVALALLRRSFVVAAVYWVIAEGAIIAPLVAIIFVVAAAATSVVLLPARRFRVRAIGLIQFVPYFVTEAIRGGVDVALRAIQRDMPLEPGYVEFETRLTTSAARVFFSNTISLLPGTLSVALRGNRLHVHALDVRLPQDERLRRLEAKIAAVIVAP